jgi:zinc transport system substrate-binding protein
MIGNRIGLLRITWHTIPLFAVVVALAGCKEASPPADVAVTNSMFECAVVDVAGEGVAIMRLAEPGMCPGHFDMRPSQIESLRGCRVLLRLDFQQSLDRKLAGVSGEGLQIAEIKVPGGLCEPDSYLAVTREIADAMVAADLLGRIAADDRLAAIEQRMAGLKERCQQRVQPIRGAAVLASVHQKAFCEGLGLDVVATFSAADTAGVGQLDHAVRAAEAANVRAIIANQPEGRRTADALADRLGVPVVMFGNFPAMTDDQATFDELVGANVEALVKAIGD